MRETGETTANVTTSSNGRVNADQTSMVLSHAHVLGYRYSEPLRPPSVQCGQNARRSRRDRPALRSGALYDHRNAVPRPQRALRPDAHGPGAGEPQPELSAEHGHHELHLEQGQRTADAQPLTRAEREVGVAMGGLPVGPAVRVERERVLEELGKPMGEP